MGFVFDGNADLSAFEPVVRKCGRILRAAELDSRYLSSPSSKHQMQSILEQIFEDLNSYSETSITVDGINYLELKLFPFYREHARGIVGTCSVMLTLSCYQQIRHPWKTGTYQCH